MIAQHQAATKKYGTPRLPIAKPSDRHHSPSHGRPPSRPTLVSTNSQGLATSQKLAEASGSPAALDLGKRAQMSLAAPPSIADIRKDGAVTVKDAAFRLGKSTDAIRLWLKTGRLKGWQPGGKWCAVMVTEESLQKALSCAAGGER